MLSLQGPRCQETRDLQTPTTRSRPKRQCGAYSKASIVVSVSSYHMLRIFQTWSKNAALPFIERWQWLYFQATIRCKAAGIRFQGRFCTSTFGVSPKLIGGLYNRKLHKEASGLICGKLVHLIAAHLDDRESCYSDGSRHFHRSLITRILCAIMVSVSCYLSPIAIQRSVSHGYLGWVAAMRLIFQGCREYSVS